MAKVPIDPLAGLIKQRAEDGQTVHTQTTATSRSLQAAVKIELFYILYWAGVNLVWKIRYWPVAGMMDMMQFV